MRDAFKVAELFKYQKPSDIKGKRRSILIKSLNSYLPEGFDAEYFYYQAAQVTYPGEITAKIPIKDICLRLGFKNHENFVDSEMQKVKD